MIQITKTSPVVGGFNCLLALGAMALTCNAIHRALPLPEVPKVSAKIRFYSEHKDEFDTVFIGSSRVYHQISPRIFDQILAESGHPTKSFNFGIDGMHPPESFFILDQVLKLKPAKLKYVFIELYPLQLKIDEDKLGTIRAVYWHDWPRTRLLLANVWNDERSAKSRRAALGRKFKLVSKQIGLCWSHVELFAQNEMNLGRGTKLNWKKAKAGQLSRRMGPNADGFLPNPLPAATKEMAVEYHRGVAQMNKTRSAGPASNTAFQAAIEQINKGGALAVLLKTPIAGPRLQSFAPEPHRAMMLAFDDAVQYPMLYDVAVRQDAHHLTATGSAEFTRLLAREFAARLPLQAHAE